MNNYFDKIFCINLDHRPGKWEFMEGQFKKYGLKVERFKAINGNPNNLKVPISNGDVGCTLSHLGVIKKAKEEKLKSILVLEDDAEFIEGFLGKFKEYYKQVPKDWQMLYLGGSHLRPIIPVSTNVAKISHTYTTHSYAIKDSVYDMVIKRFPNLQKEVDVYYADIQKIIKAYVIRPHLTWQKEGFSDIQNQRVNYAWLKK